MKEYHENGQNLLKTTLYDKFDMENEPNLPDIMEYKFDEIVDPKTYYNECIWKIKETYLKQKLSELTKKYTDEQEQSEKQNIMREIGEVQKKLRNKILED